MKEYSVQNNRSMKFCSNTIAILLVTAIEFSWLQDASARSIKSFFDDSFPFGNSNNSITEHMNILSSYRNSKSGDVQAKSPGPLIIFGSQTYQTNNVYPETDGQHVFYGSEDVQIGNTYPDNPRGTNIYGPIVFQKNNTYQGKNSKAVIGPRVTQIGNVYPKNPGKNDTYGPTVIQEDNIYPENTGNNTVIGAIVNQINNTYPQALEGNEDALNPVIHQHGNVYPSINGTNRVIGAIVNRSGNNFHPSQDHHKRPDGGITIDIVKRQHEKMNKIIYHHLQTNQPTSKRCANGIIDLEGLDNIESLYLEVKTQVAQREARRKINHYRKMICHTLANQCSKHDNMQKWIANARRMVMKNTVQSRQRRKSLRKCYSKINFLS